MIEERAGRQLGVEVVWKMPESVVWKMLVLEIVVGREQESVFVWLVQELVIVVGSLQEQEHVL